MRPLSDFPLRQQFRIALTALLVLVLAQSAFALWTTRSNQEADHRIAALYSNITLTENVLNDLVDMETGYRGFLLTGDASYLDPYAAGRQGFREDLAQVQ